MRYVDEFRDKNLVLKLSARINSSAPERQIKIMEVCGTHTQSFHRFGPGKLIPKSIRFISGPGCPVCVSSAGYIEGAISLARDKHNAILTFADMLRVPGKSSTLEKEKAKSGNVVAVYSPLEALNFAKAHPKKNCIFLGVGFETTIPAIGLTLLAAKKERVRNLFFYCSFKLIPPALEYIAKDRELCISGFLLPGHVSAVIGTKAYAAIPKKYKIACCVAGFEPLDMLEGILLLIEQINKGRPLLENQYKRLVRKEGNLKAQKVIALLFKTVDAEWRGLGVIPQSGLKLRREFSSFDAETVFGVKPARESRSLRANGCRCSEVIKGALEPQDCPLFRRRCSPQDPYGPCMISNEGSCNVHYRYAEN